MKLAALVSGGKDSVYAAYLAKKQGHEIKYDVGFISENTESYMFHVPNVHLIKSIAQLMGIKYIEVKTKGEKEKELKDIEHALEKLRKTEKTDADAGISHADKNKSAHTESEIDGIVCGAVASNYQRSRIKKICDDLGLKLFAPLWDRNNINLLKDMLKDGFEIMITAVAGGDAFDKEWLGRIIDKQTISELEKMEKKYKISPLGEGGEYESLVVNCPLYKNRLGVFLGKKHWDSATQSGWIEIHIKK